VLMLMVFASLFAAILSILAVGKNSPLAGILALQILAVEMMIFLE